MTDIVQPCPCGVFQELDTVIAALENRDRTEYLIRWLSGGDSCTHSTRKDDDTRQSDTSTRFSFSCGNGACRGRVKTSFAILNAIRDACRPFLEQTTSPINETDGSSPQTIEAQLPYEEAFPALGATKATPTMLMGRKKTKSTTRTSGNNKTMAPQSNTNNGKANKRRIRPAIVSPDATSAWENSRTSGNLVNLPSEEPSLLSESRANNSHSKALSIPSKTTVTTTPRKSRPAWPQANDIQPQQPFVTPQKESAGTTTTTTYESKRFLSKNNQEDVSTVSQLRHLIDVYCTLMDSFLVPSHVLELHLLFRMLAIQQQQQEELSRICNDEIMSFALEPVLSTTDRCIYFAQQTLQRQSHVIKGLGPPLWSKLVQCLPFCTHLPELNRELVHLLKQHQNRKPDFSFSTEQSTTALITLPFKQERDSRHNYRTREEQALYKNRETTRDAFIYQLRTFLNVRGKVVDASQTRKTIQMIQQSSRSVVADLMEANLLWFSEFFCDLLLQIGLVPVQETDKDILSIADKEKLQKLHRRFSSKTTRFDKCSRRVVADPPSRHSNSSPKEEAQHLFPGYQEFFYLFLISADSFAFGIHLRSHLIRRMRDIESQVTHETTEKVIMELCLLARFLAVLLFSPNWKPQGLSSRNEVSPEIKSLDGLQSLASLGLSVTKTLETAANEQRLVLVVPWIVELLRFTMWDTTTKLSPLYARTLSLLRQLQIETAQISSASGLKFPASQLVSQCIGSYFGEIVGLGETVKVFAFSKTTHFDAYGVSDELDTVFSSSTLYSCVPHVEELVVLVSSLSRPNMSSMKSPGVSRKLRPSTLSPVSDAVQVSGLSMNGRALDQDPIKSSEVSLTTKLRERFFHQHADLKEVCEFAVKKSLQKFCSDAFEKHALASINAKPFSNDNNKREVFVHECRELMRQDLEATTSKILAALAMHGVDETVTKIAVAIAVEQGIAQASHVAHRIVSKQALSLVNDAVPAERKQLFASEEVRSGDCSDLELDLRRITVTVLLFVDSFPSLDQETIYNILPDLEDLLSRFEKLSVYHDKTEIPPEESLRRFFLSILKLDSVSCIIVHLTLSYPNKRKWFILLALIRVAMQIQRWSHRGLHKLRQLLRKCHTFDELLRVGLTEGTVDDVFAVCNGLIDSKIIPPKQVMDSVRRSIADGTSDATTLLRHLLKTLSI